MNYPPKPRLPPFDCTCGEKFTAFKYLERHMRHGRIEQRANGAEVTHFKVRNVTRSEAASKGEAEKRRRKYNFLYNGG